MLEVGHNLRWLTDNCEWTITAENLGRKFAHKKPFKSVGGNGKGKRSTRRSQKTGLNRIGRQIQYEIGKYIYIYERLYQMNINASNVICFNLKFEWMNVF